MEAQYFDFIGKKFRPIGFIKWTQLDRVLPHCSPTGISAYGKGTWNYHAFYRQTQPPKHGELALFEMDGKIVLPLETELVEFSGEYDPWLPSNQYSFVVHVSVWSTSRWMAESIVHSAMGTIDEDVIGGWQCQRR